MSRNLTNLQQVLDQIDKTGDEGGSVSLGMIVETVGGRSFGPLLVMAGLVVVSPAGSIPGMPTLIGVLVLLIAVQLLFRRQCFWLPHWLLKRSLGRDKLGKAVIWLRPPARMIDRLLRPRMPVFIQGGSTYAIAVVCLVVAACMPVMEIVPLSVHGAGFALTAFGVSMIARDGLVALLAFAVTLGTFGTTFYNLLTP